MGTMRRLAPFAVCCVIGTNVPARAEQSSQAGQEHAHHSFRWPEGKRAAVSLSFDDARLSQVDTGLDLFRRLGIKATFFLESNNIERRLAGWKQAVADGHEIANHTMTHPCTANYAFSLDNALESYDLQMMMAQLDGANAQIQKLLGVTPKTFAYPCGQKFVGRGLDVRSYVPLVADRFVVGRGYLDESANDPSVCDLAQAMGTAFDGMDFSQMKPIVDEAIKEGRWVIFVGHEIGKRGYQVTDVKALEELSAYLKDPANGVWLGTVEEVGRYIRQARSKP
ncbi:MAG: polysaccharide deacetylase [Acidobacteria bacterium]|nr:MAG: polysaccharide deacetylase [Acidobacteriota bacterium]